MLNECDQQRRATHKYLTYKQLDLLLQEIAARPDIWISTELCQQILDSLPKL